MGEGVGRQSRCRHDEGRPRRLPGPRAGTAPPPASPMGRANAMHSCCVPNTGIS